MNTQEEEAIGVQLGDLDHLDGGFESLRHHLQLELPFKPRCAVQGRVLLTGSGPRRSGGLYVFVGMLHGVRLDNDKPVLRFRRVQRFWRPVVGVYQAKGYRREDLLGRIQGWGPTGMYYFPLSTLDLVAEEAETALVCKDGRKK